MNDADRWWAAALSEEVVATSPLSAYCGATPVVLFRDAEGIARALEDRCAHRRAALSDGRVRAEGWIECPYHGWSYEGVGGACKAIPNLNADESPPARYGVRAFAVSEQDGFVFVNDGDAAQAPRQVGGLATPVGEAGWTGAGLLSFPHENFVELLLDAPNLVLDIAGVEVVSDYPFGDPRREGDVLVRAFAADWRRLARKRQRLAADYSLTVEVQVELGTGLARVELRDDTDETLAAALIASTPARPAVTSLRWRGAGTGPAIKIRPAIDPAGLMKMIALAGPMWRLASQGRSAPYVVAA